MLFRRSTLVALLLVGLSPKAFADDGLAAFRNGALVFGQSRTIAMKAETLTVSRSLITADFQFVNTGDKAETVTIAFPLPDMNTADNDGLDIPVADSDNFVGFTTQVDGKPVKQGLEQHAFAPSGRDVTADLKAAGVPLARPYGTYVDLFPTLPKKTLAKLVAIGAVAGTEGDFSPQWVTKSKFFFDQTFAPGKAVHIVHSYKPSLDTSNMSFYSGDMKPEANQIRLYCLDDRVKNAVKALEAKKTGDYAYASQFSLSYILSTARTWSGPIGDFHLIIDKEKPEAVVQFCIKARQTSPTRYQFDAKNYVPDRDLDLVFFE